MPAIAIAIPIPGISAGKEANNTFPNYFISSLYFLQINLPAREAPFFTKGHERTNL